MATNIDFILKQGLQVTNAVTVGSYVGSYVAPANSMIISGSVAIGTPTATNLLTVANGNIQVSTVGFGLIFPDGTRQTTAATGTAAQGTVGSIQVTNGTGSFQGNSNFVFDSNNVSVGIGTTLPVNNGLTVINANNPALFSTKAAGADNQIIVGNSSTVGTVLGYSTSGYSYIRNTGSTYGLIIGPTGNIGVSSTLVSTSTTTGALTVAGGVGIAGALYVGGISNLPTIVSTGSSSLGAVTITGQLSNAGNTYTNALYSNTLISGASVVSSGVITGSSIVSNTSVTGANLIATSGITTPTLSATGTITANSLVSNTAVTSQTGQFNATTAATNTTSGALQVVGGAGIGGSLYVGGNSQFNGNLSVLGNLLVSGNSVVINTTSLAVTDPVIQVGVGSNDSILTVDDGHDRGILINYFNTTAINGESQGDNNAFFGRQDSTGKLVYLTNVSPGTTNVANPFQSGTTVWGAAEFGSLTLANAAPSTSTGTGALIVTGGAGIGGNVYIGGTLNAGAATFTTLSSGGAITAPAFISTGTSTFANIVSNSGITTGTLSASGTITGATLVSNGSVTGTQLISSGTITGATLVSNGSVTGTQLISSGAINGATLVTHLLAVHHFQ
jgi:hypothetical protein